MKAQMSRLLNAHIKVFKFVGYCTLSYDENFKRSTNVERFLILYSTFLLIAFNVITLIALTSNDAFLFTEDTFGYFNDILKVVFADIAVTIAYLEAIFRRTALYEFWKIYYRLQKQTAREIPSKYLKEIWQNRRFLGIFYSFILLESVLMVLFVVYQTMTRHLVLFWSIFTPFIYAVHLRNIQFIFYIELLRTELVKLKQDLSLMVDYSRIVAYGCGFKGFEEFLRSKLVEKQKNYQMIYEMYEQFQNSFGISIVFVLLMIYVRVLVDAYFGYYTVYRGWNKVGMFSCIKRFPITILRHFLNLQN